MNANYPEEITLLKLSLRTEDGNTHVSLLGDATDKLSPEQSDELEKAIEVVNSILVDGFMTSVSEHFLNTLNENPSKILRELSDILSEEDNKKSHLTVIK